jgi:hypothetical protein
MDGLTIHENHNKKTGESRFLCITKTMGFDDYWMVTPVR